MRVEATSFPCRRRNAETKERKVERVREDDRERTRREVAREAERDEDVPSEPRTRRELE